MIAPQNKDAASSKPPRRSGQRRGVPYLAAILIVAVAIAGILCFIQTTSESDESEVNSRTSLIGEAGKTQKTPRDVARNDGDAAGQVEGQGIASSTNANVEVEVPNSPKVNPRMVGRLVKPPVRKKLFKHPCDAQIGRVLSIRPGGLVLGTINYHRNHFVENFRKSLEDPEPVVFSDDDTPEEAELKAAVIEARAELKAALDRGEDIAEIMQEAEAELHEMQQYRMAMREQMLSYQKEDGVTVEDLEDFNAAVNQMLSEKGIKPVRSAKLQAIKARLHREKNL